MATLQAGSMLTSVGSLCSTILLAFILGPREQGNYFASIALFGLVSLILSGGIGAATISQVSAAHARGKIDKIAGWLAFQVKANLIISGLTCVGGYWFFPWLAGLEFMGGNERIGELAWWVTLMPLLDLPRGAAISAFQSSRKMIAVAQTENAHEAMRVFLVTTGAVVTGTAQGAIGGMLLASLLSSSLSLELYRVTRQGGESGLPSIANVLSHLRDVPVLAGLPLGFRLGLLRSTDALVVQIMPILIINAIAGSEIVAFTKTAQRIMSVPQMLTAGVSRALFPVMYRFAGLKDVVRFKRAFLRATLAGGMLTSTAILLELLVVHWVVGMVWPERYVGPVTLIAPVIAIGNIVSSFALGLDAFHVVAGTTKWPLRVNVFAIPWTALVTIYCCQNIPLTGGAWGISLTTFWALVQYVYLVYVYRRLTTLETPAPVPQAAT